jgi:GrpB-like predicted nucleotidyltransferase (UPF0157 family)/quercetin dioxygenase-like cupin family protein
MLIVCFDPELSRPVPDFGSRFKAGSLTGPGSTVQVQVLHLPAGGLVGRHEAPARQLFAVVAGQGWASGADGVRKRLRTGCGAVWDKGEEHEAGSDGGMTAVCIEGDFDVWAPVLTREIVVSDYDPEWPLWFNQVHGFVWPAVEDLAIRIDHVGSTSVPGLAAKPIIDMDIVVRSEADIPAVIERLAGIGYRWMGDFGVVGREAFYPPASPTSGPELPLPEHHLYLVVEDNRAHMDHWLLRDLLRADPDARERYGTLKRHNVDVAQGDIDVYLSAKAQLVAELLARARAERGFPPVSYWEPDDTFR